MTDLYPQVAGWKVTDTSREAAESVRHTTAEAYSGIMAVLRRYGPMTADEIAEQMNLSVLFVRPRCTELKAKGYVEPTGDRRPNSSGRSADVLRIVR